LEPVAAAAMEDRQVVEAVADRFTLPTFVLHLIRYSRQGLLMPF
jgi:hypothetical protein